MAVKPNLNLIFVSLPPFSLLCELPKSGLQFGVWLWASVSQIIFQRRHCKVQSCLQICDLILVVVSHSVGNDQKAKSQNPTTDKKVFLKVIATKTMVKINSFLLLVKKCFPCKPIYSIVYCMPSIVFLVTIEKSVTMLN